MARSTGTPKRRSSADTSVPKRHRAPGKTIESRESQLISLATDVAADLMRRKVAPSQVVLHYLKLGSSLAQLEKEKLRKENLLIEAKVEQIKSQQKSEELYAQALKALSLYKGEEAEGDKDED